MCVREHTLNQTTMWQERSGGMGRDRHVEILTTRQPDPDNGHHLLSLLVCSAVFASSILAAFFCFLLLLLLLLACVEAMAASLASPRHTRIPDPLRDGTGAPSSSSRVRPESSFKITPYGHKSSYPYGHYQRPVNYEGPLDDVKQKIRASKDHSKVNFAEEDDYSSDSDSDGELDESPRRHKVKKLGVL